MIRAFRLDTAESPVIIQSFELNNLIELREKYSLAGSELLLTSSTGKGFGDTDTYAQLISPPV
jgi:glycerophosphoryl diester phosphodiesterase